MHGWAPEDDRTRWQAETCRKNTQRLLHRIRDGPRGGTDRLPHACFGGAQGRPRRKATSWQNRLAQYDAVCALGGRRTTHARAISAIDKPVWGQRRPANPMIPPSNSF